MSEANKENVQMNKIQDFMAQNSMKRLEKFKSIFCGSNKHNELQ